MTHGTGLMVRGSCRRGSLELDPVAFRVVEIEGRPLAIGAEAGADLPGLDPMSAQMADDGVGVERLTAETALANSATTESPAVPKTRPLCSAIMESTICL